MTTTLLTPTADTQIYEKYNKKQAQNKEKNKIAFCEEFNLPYEKKVPLLIMTYAQTEQNGSDVLEFTIEGIMEHDVELALLAVGTQKAQKMLNSIADKYPKKVAIIPDEEGNRNKMLAAGNILLVPKDSEECIKEAEKAMAYGTLPVIPQTEFVEDYNPIQEKGNAFVMQQVSPWSFFSALVRAIENFKFPYDWKNLMVSAMEISEPTPSVDMERDGDDDETV